MKRAKLAGTVTYVVVVLASGGTHLLLAGWGEALDRNAILATMFTLWGLMLLAYAVVMGVHGRRAWMPDWTHRFELLVVPATPGGLPAAVVRCNRCDATVLPRAAKITLPRLLSYTHTHTALACEPRRKTDPEDTRRLDSPQRRRQFSRPTKRTDRP